MRSYIFIFGLLALVGGCASPTLHSLDSRANYGYVFGDLSAPEPTIIHSHVERLHRSVLGIFPLPSQYNGDWEFELVASSTWVDQVKQGFTGITVQKRSAIILVVVAVFLLVGGFVWISQTNGTLMATAQKRGPSGSDYSVTVRRFGDDYRTELLYRGKFPISSCQFYEGSVPPTNAVINWPKLDEFSVSFDNGMSVRCTWDSLRHDKPCWERK